jgi:DUF1009 family protein
MLPNKIGIIAGQGLLPKELYEAALKKGLEVFVIGLTDQVDLELFQAVPIELLPLSAVSQIIKKLKSHGIKDLVLAGRVKRASIPKFMLDLKGAKLLARIIKNGLSDKSLSKTVIKFFETEGFNIISAEAFADELAVKQGFITESHPNKIHIQDIEKGLKMLREVSKLDIGQALIIQNGLILGVEAAEGTNELIKRCGIIRQKNDSEPVLVKICKPNQDKRIDLPCVGDITIEYMHDYGIKGMALESGLCLMLNKDKTLELANKYGIFIYGL